MRWTLGLGLLVACTSGGSGPIGGGDAGTTSSSSGNTSSSSSGEVDPAPAAPQAIATINGGAAAECATVPALKLGEFGETGNRPVQNGAVESGATANVACRVASNGGSFAVEVTIGLGTTTLTVRSDVDSAGASSAAKMNLVGNGATWSSDTCKLEAATALMGVASGRYWAMLSCPGATSASGDTCDIFGQVRVENCTQN